MALPKIETPTYDLTLPSQDIKVKFRPFSVREEKVLLMAQESGKKTDITNTVVNVLSACTFNAIELKHLPLFDIEYLFLNVRAKSVSEIAKFKVICPDDMKTRVDVELDLTKVDVQVDDKHTNDIMLDDSRKLGVIFKYPSLNVLDNNNLVDADDMKTEDIFKLIINCIDHIYEGEKIYPAKDSTVKELQEFIESLQSNQFEKMQEFFKTMPVLKHEVEVENPNTKKKNMMTFQGLNDFFSSASPTTH
mgnify:CR=1 FL=1